MKIATIKNVQALFDFEISSATASRKITLCRDALNKPKPKILLLSEFKEYFGLPIN